MTRRARGSPHLWGLSPRELYAEAPAPNDRIVAEPDAQRFRHIIVVRATGNNIEQTGLGRLPDCCQIAGAEADQTERAPFGLAGDGDVRFHGGLMTAASGQVFRALSIGITECTPQTRTR